MARPPIIAGIDLGTTNCAAAWADARTPDAALQLFAIPQLTSPATIDRVDILPSFLFFPEPHEIENGEVALPWDPRPDAVAGILARDRAALTPARVAASAKSWLAHPGVDRRAPILPWGAESGPRISPVECSSRYLSHIRDAWNTTVAGRDATLRLERQRIVLTVPASFDEEARELTVDAARLAGFEHLTLLEEPIAAFYAWMAQTQGTANLDGPRLALVCDLGGGTTDFSLIRIALDRGAPSFERVAIGEHLLLGGDNVDLALAARVERRMLESHPDRRLTITQRAALRRACAAAKEQLLGDSPPDRVGVTVLGTGRALVGGALRAELSRDDAIAVMDDFLPISEPGEMAAPRDRRAGLRELGLPYETDPAITRHLAAFLARSAAALGDDALSREVGGHRLVRPELILFNGGFFRAARARERVIAALARWFGRPPEVLDTPRLEAAVALGAAAYGRIRAGIGPPLAVVKAGSGRAYYVGLQAGRAGDVVPAVCVLERGTPEGTATRLPHRFTVVANRPVAFALYSSLVRADRTGDIVSLPIGTEDLHEHAPLVTVLRYGRRSREVELPVQLAIAFTEVGTLEIWCESQVSDHRWRLQFHLRAAQMVADAAPGEQAQAAAGVVPRAAPPVPAATRERARARDDARASRESVPTVESAQAAPAGAAAQVPRAERELSRPPATTPAHGGTERITPAGEAVMSDEAIEAGVRAIHDVFGGTGADSIGAAENLTGRLEEITGYAKSAWPLPVLRRFADALIAVADGRRRSPAHEMRWLNLFGFCVRPGLGAAKDPWRISEARKVYAAGLVFPKAVQNAVEWLVLWQRAAGGFTPGQQRDLAQQIMGELGLGGRRARRMNPQMERESWRLLASLERLDAGLRRRLGDAVLEKLRRDPDNPSYWWALGRLGARTPLYGPLTSVVMPEHATRWLEMLRSCTRVTPEMAAAAVQIAARTGDPLRDVDESVRREVRDRLTRAGYDDDALRPLVEIVSASPAEVTRVFGEPLPAGLRLQEQDESARG